MTLGRGAHQDQQALPLIGLVFQAHIHVDAVGPDINVLFLGEVAANPFVVFLDHCSLSRTTTLGERGAFLADQRLQRFRKVARRDALEVQPGNQFVEGLTAPQVGRQDRRREPDAIFLFS